LSPGRGQHPGAEVQADRHASVTQAAARVNGELAGPGRHIEECLARPQLAAAEARPAPPAVQAEGEEAGEAVVAGRGGDEAGVDEAGAAFGRPSRGSRGLHRRAGHWATRMPSIPN